MISGRTFVLINRKTGTREHVWVPYNGQTCDDLIVSTSSTLFVGSSRECFDFIISNASSRKAGVASAYILTDGRCVLLLPHHHDEVARVVLTKLLVPQTHDYDRGFVGRLNSTLMPLYTGAIRVQMLPDGIGLTIDEIRPPSQHQLQAVQEYYDLTSGETFVAEVNCDGRLVGLLRSFPELNRSLTGLP